MAQKPRLVRHAEPRPAALSPWFSARRSRPHRRRIIRFETRAVIHNLPETHRREINRPMRTRISGGTGRGISDGDPCSIYASWVCRYMRFYGLKNICCASEHASASLSSFSTSNQSATKVSIRVCDTRKSIRAGICIKANIENWPYVNPEVIGDGANMTVAN